MKKINCIGIIIDGNRRWARKNNLSVSEGHKVGYEHLKDFLRWVKEAGIKNVVAYAFSLENWKRNPIEVSSLVSLIDKVFLEKSDDFIKNKVSVKFICRLELFPIKMIEKIKNIEKRTAKLNQQHLTLAISYGGREEIIHSIKKCIQQKKPVTEKNISKNLYNRDLPDPDIIIRTSGEMRLSGFLTWQSIYSELFFTKTLWPDFSKGEFLDILGTYNKRERRMGK